VLSCSAIVLLLLVGHQHMLSGALASRFTHTSITPRCCHPSTPDQQRATKALLPASCFGSYRALSMAAPASSTASRSTTSAATAPGITTAARARGLQDATAIIFGGAHNGDAARDDTSGGADDGGEARLLLLGGQDLAPAAATGRPTLHVLPVSRLVSANPATPKAHSSSSSSTTTSAMQDGPQQDQLLPESQLSRSGSSASLSSVISSVSSGSSSTTPADVAVTVLVGSSSGNGKGEGGTGCNTNSRSSWLPVSAALSSWLWGGGAKAAYSACSLDEQDVGGGSVAITIDARGSQAWTGAQQWLALGA
jgi:hypothetical protein